VSCTEIFLFACFAGLLDSRIFHQLHLKFINRAGFKPVPARYRYCSLNATYP
jgi:hypothetical protein